MADDDIDESTPDAAVEAEGGDSGDEADNEADNEASADEPVEEPSKQAVNGKESLTPYRAAKMAGIAIGAVLVCAAIVVAAVWAIAAIVDDEEDDDEDWSEYVSPSAFEDGVYKAYERGYGKGPLAEGSRRGWPSKHQFARPGFLTKGDAYGIPPGFGACEGPVVVFVVPGVGLGDWGHGSDFGFGAPGGGPQDLLPFMLPFLENEGWLGGGELPGGWGLEGFFDESNLEIPQLQGDLSLEAHELDNEALPGLEGLTPT